MIGKLLRWGNSYGIRLSKSEVERRNLREGQEYDIRLADLPAKRINLDHFPTYKLGGLSQHHDEVDWA